MKNRDFKFLMKRCIILFYLLLVVLKYISLHMFNRSISPGTNLELLQIEYALVVEYITLFRTANVFRRLDEYL